MPAKNAKKERAGRDHMPPVGLVHAFVVLWWPTGLVLLYLSVRTAYHGLQPGTGHDPHAVLIGGVEAFAALLFLVPWTLRVGAVGLLVILALVFLIHAVRVEFRGDLLVYAAAVLFVAVHGAVPVSWLRPGL
jgi:predicted secreted protein